MGNYEQLIAAIEQVIKTNGNNEITGAILQNTLKSIVNSIGANATFAGVATPSTNPGSPDQNIFYIAFESGTYANFSGITLNKGDFCALVNTGGAWSKKYLGIASESSVKSILPLEDSNRDYIYSTISNIYIVDDLVRKNDWTVTYFWTNSPSSGGTGFLLIQLTADGELNNAYNFSVNISEATPGQYLKMTLRKDSAASQALEGIRVYVRMADDFVFSDVEKLITEAMPVNSAFVGTQAPLISSLLDSTSEAKPKFGIKAYAPAQDVYGETIYGEYGIATNDFSDVSRKSLWRGDFSLIDHVEETTAQFILRTVKNIKLISGFDRTVQYFIASIKKKAGGETEYFYILLKSLPSADYEFECRVPAGTVKKGIPVYITDEARNRTILITLSDYSDDSFSQNVVYYQDALINKNAFVDEMHDIRYHHVTVNSTDNFAIRNKVKECQGKASYFDRYVVDIPDGEYFEMDIDVPNFVTVRGESEKGVIIRLDGGSNIVAPSDLSIGTGGVPINQMDISYKHIFWLCANATVENMTLEITKVKYAIHQDSNVQKYESKVRNVTLKDNGSSIKLVGLGLFGGQKASYENCTFFCSTTVLEAIVAHNWNAQEEPCELYITGCIFSNNALWAQELGSGMQDIFKVTNCICKIPYEGNVQYSKSPGYESAKICIKIIIEGKSLGTYSGVEGYEFMNVN